jgi:hypothetical protein
MNKIFKKSCNEPALFTHRPSLLNCPGRLAGVTGILLEPGFPGAVITDKQRACFKPLSVVQYSMNDSQAEYCTLRQLVYFQDCVFQSCRSSSTNIHIVTQARNLSSAILSCNG